jgi:cytoskeletal protein RodZ
MKISYLSLLTVAIVIASIIIAGCTTSNQVNQGSSSETSTNASSITSATTTTAAATFSTVKPSPSSSPTATPTPSESAKIATSIQFTSPSVKKGQSVGINVISSATGLRICTPGLITATPGSVKSEGSDCYYTAFLDTSSLNQGKNVVKLEFKGDSTYQPSQNTLTIEITA